MTYRAYRDRRMRAMKAPRGPAAWWGGPRPGIAIRTLSDAELRARIYWSPPHDAPRQEHVNAAGRRLRARRELARRDAA